MNVFRTPLSMHFQAEIKGEIQIKFCREKTEECINSREKSKNENCNSTIFILTVSDDGVGVPGNIVFEDIESLGFQLVTSLMDQLDGELELKRNNGTEFTMWFTVEEKKQKSIDQGLQFSWINFPNYKI